MDMRGRKSRRQGNFFCYTVIFSSTADYVGATLISLFYVMEFQCPGHGFLLSPDVINVVRVNGRGSFYITLVSLTASVFIRKHIARGRAKAGR